jgi:hypothetical protein
MRLKVPVIIGSPIQTAPFNNLPRDLIRGMRESYRKGIITIVPIGNFGPLPGLINPFAKQEGVISVGAATVDGKELLSFSSKGIPGKIYSGPSIVAPGKDIIGRCHSGIIEFLLAKQELMHLITKERFYQQRARSLDNNEFMDVKKNFVVGSGSSQAVELVVEIVGKLVNLRYINGMSSPPKKIREILIDMAEPMIGYGNHEVGGGFINMFVFAKYVNLLVKSEYKTKNTRRLWEKPVREINLIDNLVTVQWMDNTYNNTRDFTGTGIMSNDEKLKKYYEGLSNGENESEKGKDEIKIY